MRKWLVKMHQREATSCSCPLEPYTTWTLRKTNVIEAYASILKHGWQNRFLSWAAESDIQNVDWSPIYFIFKVFANIGCVGLPHCQQHWNSLRWAKSPILSQLQYFKPFPIMTQLGDCLKASRQGFHWLSCRY